MEELKPCPIIAEEAANAVDVLMQICPQNSEQIKALSAANKTLLWIAFLRRPAPGEDEPSKEELITALDQMAEYLGECAECPAAATGRPLGPECNGEAETCGDNRTVGGCWKQYFLEKARTQKDRKTDDR